WSSDVCSSDLSNPLYAFQGEFVGGHERFDRVVPRHAGRAEPVVALPDRREQSIEREIVEAVRANVVGDLRDGHSRGDELVAAGRAEEHTSELQSRENFVCRLLLETKRNID